LNFEVTDASKRAIDLIKAAGGSVICIFRTRLKVREHLKPEKFPINLDDSLPSLKSVKKYERIRDRGLFLMKFIRDFKGNQELM
jgi:large subunit ribosomal protein L15